MSGTISAYLTAVIGAELGCLSVGKTKIDIIMVPTVVIVAGGLVMSLTASAITAGIAALQRFLESTTTLQPIPMGIIVSVVFGLALLPHLRRSTGGNDFTAPDGSVIGPDLRLAAGAATVGCCQMVGFVVSSYRETGFPD